MCSIPFDYSDLVRITQAQSSAIRSALSKRPDLRKALRNFASDKGFDLDAYSADYVRTARLPIEHDITDSLSEGEMTHISRPEGLKNLHNQGMTGKGVTVAVVDSGIAPHPDLKDRIVTFRDFTSGRRTVKKNPLDTTGHGTHVAGIIAGHGSEITGIAPEADLIGLRINSEKEAIKAIDWAIANKEKYSIDILNLSLGVDAPKNPAEDEFRKAAERAVRAGLIVVAAAGNECHGGSCRSTISSPGISPDVITVGALDDRGTGKQSDDVVYATSSRGKENGGKPDLIAEGVNVLAPLAPKSSFAHGLAKSANYVALAGSSQAAPMVSGTIALMLEANPDLSQRDVKQILKRTADTIPGFDKAAQGAGRLDVKGAVMAAKRRASTPRKV